MNSQVNRSRQLSKVAQRRLSRELSEWSVKEPPVPGMAVATTDRLDEWLVSVQGAEGSVYAGELYRLRFVFPSEYPMEAPEVVFLQPTPRHPHVYSNGHSMFSALTSSIESHRSWHFPTRFRSGFLFYGVDFVRRLTPFVKDIRYRLVTNRFILRMVFVVIFLSLPQCLVRWMVASSHSDISLLEPRVDAEQRKGEGRP
jgi:ubiquitin-protein ligase